MIDGGHVRTACLFFLLGIAHDAGAQHTTVAVKESTDAGVTDLATIEVVAPRAAGDLYRSKAPALSPPTRFDRAWREPLSLEEIGDQGGVIPLLVNYAARKMAEGARRIPGWKGPDQPAVARPPPLNDVQLTRAVQLHGTGSGPR